MNILIVEDTQHSLMVLEQLLVGSGHTVVSAMNGRQALDLLGRSSPVDLIISDALMPVMDGFEFCYHLRKSEAFCNLPFILYTATYTEESDESFARTVGVDCFLVKPTEPENLLKIIDEVVREVAARPVRRSHLPPIRPVFFEQHARKVSLKLEDKLGELARVNENLSSSERSVRELNHRLQENVNQLQLEVGERRRVEELLRLAFCVGRMGSWELTRDGERFIPSAELLEILGVDKQHTEALPLFVSGVTEPAAQEALREFLLIPGALPELRVQYSHPRLGGRHLLLRRQSLLSDPKSLLSQLGTVQDITEETEAEAHRKSLEKQLFKAQKMEALGNLASGIAHDFNNILTTILGHAELIQADCAEHTGLGNLATCAGEIVNAAQRSRETIQQILTFSRRQSIERRPAPLGPIVNEALRLVKTAQGGRVHLHCQIASDRWALVNETQIHQIVINLCTNAAYAMRQKGGRIDVSLHSLDIDASSPSPRPDGRTGPQLVLKVADTGVGIPPEVMEHIFEPFFTTKPADEGTGLGLSVVHGIVQSHDASIRVESTIGVGTVFTLFFPAVCPGTSPETGLVSPALEVGGAPPRHVLIVDDEPSSAQVCMVILNRLGYRTTVLTDPTEARSVYQRTPEAFDAAIIDSLMPRLTGRDLALAMRAIRADMPIVMVAGFGTLTNQGPRGQELACEIITKPFTSTHLQDALLLALEHKVAGGSG